MYRYYRALRSDERTEVRRHEQAMRAELLRGLRVRLSTDAMPTIPEATAVGYGHYMSVPGHATDTPVTYADVVRGNTRSDAPSTSAAPASSSSSKRLEPHRFYVDCRECSRIVNEAWKTCDSSLYYGVPEKDRPQCSCGNSLFMRPPEIFLSRSTVTFRVLEYSETRSMEERRSRIRCQRYRNLPPIGIRRPSAADDDELQLQLQLRQLQLLPEAR